MIQKKKLIILHGWNGSVKSWKKFIFLAEEKYDVHFVLLPCFDGMPCPNSVWGIQEYADYVKKEIVNIEKCEISGTNSKSILLAHSFGGQIASLLVVQHPELISKLILCGAAAIRPKKIIKKIILLPLVFASKIFQKNKMTRSVVLKLRRSIYRLVGGHDYIEATGTKLEIFKKIIKEDLTERVVNIITPTTILWGRNDTYTPLWQGRKLAKLIPNSKLYIQKNGRHGLHITHPQWILDKINL